jgi:hypothetical protein
MKPSFRAAAAAALAVFVCASALASFPAFADAPSLTLRPGEVATPSALAEGEQYLSISKGMACSGTQCAATIKGRKNKQTVITHITCLTFANDATVAFGAATETAGSQVTLAIFPVQSRTLFGPTENAVLGGPTQIVLGPEDSFFFGVVASGPIQQAVCNLTGTTTKQ